MSLQRSSWANKKIHKHENTLHVPVYLGQTEKYMALSNSSWANTKNAKIHISALVVMGKHRNTLIQKYMQQPSAYYEYGIHLKNSQYASLWANTKIHTYIIDIITCNKNKYTHFSPHTTTQLILSKHKNTPWPLHKIINALSTAHNRTKMKPNKRWLKY